MMKFLATMVAAAALTVASASGASAAVSYTVVTDWDPYNLTAASTGSTGGGTWNGSDPAQLVSPGGSVDSLHRSPFDGSGSEDPADGYTGLPYWAIGPNNPLNNLDHQATLDFASPRNGFSFVWGSVDNYNTVTLTGGPEPDLVLSLASLTALGLGTIPQGVGAIFVTVTDYVFNSIIFKSSPNEALEVGLFASVPIPAGVLLLGSGLAGLGFLGWRRKRTTDVAGTAAA
jgi:hypothetical protein